MLDQSLWMRCLLVPKKIFKTFTKDCNKYLLQMRNSLAAVLYCYTANICSQFSVIGCVTCATVIFSCRPQAVAALGTGKSQNFFLSLCIHRFLISLFVCPELAFFCIMAMHSITQHYTAFFSIAQHCSALLSIAKHYKCST